jgi:hypothetical protein
MYFEEVLDHPKACGDGGMRRRRMFGKTLLECSEERAAQTVEVGPKRREGRRETSLSNPSCRGPR